ncbi:putative F-box/kelch-repeat protein At3g22730 [Arabidopsis lyrata subsp. lyrata]|uniref:putative F-box/kelch-repeat protein At3g22730 n=1 Tax=Arabidopsis lyrata subsp. lyrata TaxID=81972 RepID=UPI000A29E67D|nr:putative F-box/kelch-repeat protein At3g22730 [Arabidopsis lyrata subsp. lyrata]|eukprot:XP_020886707.1 putative F-box/kelch-repeat protein At3g22730 [Arabidopsis lyrata subsp. lyrata]
MMMSDLPLDLVEEILSRVPSTSLKRLRSTCKRWNALFKDQIFTEKHFRKAPKEFKVLMLKEYRVCPISVNLKVAPLSVEFKGGLGLKDSHTNLEEVDIYAVIQCDGLLLCITINNNKRLMVWNPCSGQTRWIQPKTSYEWDSMFSLGYEKQKSGRSYKILMYCDGDDYSPHGRVNEFEIFEFSSDSWRVLDDVVLEYCSILSIIGVSLKGNSYWLAYNKKDNYDQFLLCFDFTAERFERMCLPLVVGRMALSVVGEKQLSVLSQSDSTSKIDIWITNEIDNDIKGVLQWSKSFTVDIPFGGYNYLFFLSFLNDEEKKVALCCDRSCQIGKNKVYIIGEGDENYTEIVYAESTNKLWWHPFIFSYVPSLVQIQQGRCKRE